MGCLHEIWFLYWIVIISLERLVLEERVSVVTSPILNLVSLEWTEVFLSEYECYEIVILLYRFGGSY